MKKKLTFLLTMIVMILETSMICFAAELEPDSLYQLTQDAQIYEQPDENSNVVAELPAGTGVICISSNDMWTEIKYQDIQGYVSTDNLKLYGDVTALDQEFQEVQNENDLRYGRMEAYISQQKSEKIWGSVIVVLIIAIFAVGIVSTVKRNKNQSTDMDDSKEE